MSLDVGWRVRLGRRRSGVIASAAVVLLASADPSPLTAQGGSDAGVTPTLLMDRAEIRVYRVILQPGAVRSVHSHDDVEYHVWVPLEGTPELSVGSDPPVSAAPGDAFFLERGTTHGFRNPGTVPAEIMEVFVYASSVASGDDLRSSLAAVIGRSSGATAQQPELLTAMNVDGRLRFTSPLTINWEQLAPRELIDFDIDQPDEALLSSLNRLRNMFDDAEVEFAAPLPATLEQDRFYWIGPDGVQEIRAKRLTGTVRFSFERERTIASRTVYGHIEASSLDGTPLADPGFVLASSRRQRFVIQDAVLDLEALLPEQVHEHWTALPLKARQFWTVAHAYTFRFDGDGHAHTFVQWVPDTACYEACCRERYSVLAGESSPTIVATYDGDCDI